MPVQICDRYPSDCWRGYILVFLGRRIYWHCSFRCARLNPLQSRQIIKFWNVFFFWYEQPAMIHASCKKWSCSVEHSDFIKFAIMTSWLQSEDLPTSQNAYTFLYHKSLEVEQHKRWNPEHKRQLIRGGDIYPLLEGSFLHSLIKSVSENNHKRCVWFTERTASKTEVCSETD